MPCAQCDRTSITEPSECASESGRVTSPRQSWTHRIARMAMSMAELVRRVADTVFIPFTVGGGIFPFKYNPQAVNLGELRKQGITKPILGETTLTSQKVIELAGDAANGAIAHVGLTADAPLPTMNAYATRSAAERPTKSLAKRYAGTAADDIHTAASTSAARYTSRDGLPRR